MSIHFVLSHVFLLFYFQGGRGHNANRTGMHVSRLEDLGVDLYTYKISNLLLSYHHHHQPTTTTTAWIFL